MAAGGIMQHQNSGHEVYNGSGGMTAQQVSFK